MIGRLNHVAIAVRDIAAASEIYRNTLGAEVSAPEALEEHGVTVVFITLPNTKVELLEPLGAESPIARFLEKNPDGGMHHICFEVDDINAARDRLVNSGARVLGSGEPKIGAHGKPVLFLHPKDFNGTLIELEQAGGQAVDKLCKSSGRNALVHPRRGGVGLGRRDCRRRQRVRSAGERRSRIVFRDLVDSALRRSALRDPQPGGNRRRCAGKRAWRAGSSGPARKGDLDHPRGFRRPRHRRRRLSAGGALNVTRKTGAEKEKARLSPCLYCLLAIFDPWLSQASASGRVGTLFLPKLGP